MWKYIYAVCPDTSYEFQKIVEYGVFVDDCNNIIWVNGCDSCNGNAVCTHCRADYFNSLIRKPIPIPNDVSHPVRL